MTTRRNARLAAALVASSLALAACPVPLAPDDGAALRGAATTLHVFLGGLHVATVEERAADGVVERTSHLVGASRDVSHLRVRLDERGFVQQAAYRRRGPRGDRDASLAWARGRTSYRTPHGEHLLADGPPVVFLETLPHLRLAAPASVVFVDVTSGETLRGSVRPDGAGVLALDEHGAVLARASADPLGREGPGQFLERTGDPPSVRLPLHPAIDAFPGSSRRVRLRGLEALKPASLALDASGQRALAPDLVAFDETHRETTEPRPAHALPAPFVESGHDDVRAFAARHATSGVPSADALSLANAIHAMLDTRGGGGPPSALGALTRKTGDCDDATALLVASLRARGHPARAVVGYRHHDGKLVPHAWAEVHDGRAWLPVDALVPGLGPFSTHLRLFEGLGSPLTMGRVLGALRVELVPVEVAADQTGPAETR